MAGGLKHAILNLLLVLIAARVSVSELHISDATHKVRRNTGGITGNSNQWTKDETINKLRKELIASLPANLPAYLINSRISEGKDKDVSPALAKPVEHFTDGNNAIDNLRLPTYLSRHPSRNHNEEALDKRNGFFYGKRNGFFYGKRDTEAVESKSCTRCGPNDSGRCVGYGMCCSEEHGCYMMTKEAAVCRIPGISPCLSEERFQRCGMRGICVANGVCCSPRDGACTPEPKCSIHTDEAAE